MKKDTYMLLAMVANLTIIGGSVGLNVIRGAVVMRTPTEAHINLGSNQPPI